MPRIRTIKPEFFTSEDVVALSPMARLLYVALWCESDREGRFTWKPSTWKLRYFPADACDCASLAAELEQRALVVRYGVDGGFGVIPTFRSHQHLNPREAPSALPDPESVAPFGVADTTELVHRAPELTRHDASVTRAHASVTRREEGKGREGKGVRVTHASAPDWVQPFHALYQTVGAIGPATLAKALAPIRHEPEALIAWELWCADAQYRRFPRSTAKYFAESWRGVFDDVAKHNPVLLAHVRARAAERPDQPEAA
jgi:hypothetical protein